jgi:phospholipid/cholesterol/gamma-HCH transport system substrate-binding protein
MSAEQAPMPEPRQSERSLRDQLERYRTAFFSLMAMIVLALLIGGYIFAHQNLALPGWFPVLGKEFVTLKAEFRTAQAVAPGQGQEVTIAGAKIGEIASVQAHEGAALVTMNVTPKYARYIYRDATMLLRPKTGLKDMTVEVDPGTPSAGRVPSGYTVPLSHTAPDVNLEEFLSSFDTETRAALQELLAGAAGGLKGNSARLSAAFKRFDPLTRYISEIVAQLKLRDKNIARGIHNFQLIVSALGSKDTQLAQLIDASNSVFQTFAQQQRSFERTIALLPGTLAKTKSGLGKLATATATTGSTLHKLEPTATSLAPAQEASRSLFEHSTPIFENQLRPFAREAAPVVEQLAPSIKQLGEAFPGLETSFSVLNELFNEFAYNPGGGRPGFLFFLLWGGHDLNSVLSGADAHGPIGRTVAYLNCEVLPLLKNVGEINASVRLLVALFNPPTGEECVAHGLAAPAENATVARAARVGGRVRSHRGGPLTLKLLGPKSPFGRLVSARGGHR